MVTPLKTILKAVTKTLKLEPAAYLAATRQVWPTIAGPVVSAASTPVGLRGKRLFIGVTHPAVGQEIKLRQAEFVRALSKQLGRGTIEAIVPVPRRHLDAPGRHVRRRS
jgi:hypothetical protein